MTVFWDFYYMHTYVLLVRWVNELSLVRLYITASHCFFLTPPILVLVKKYTYGFVQNTCTYTVCQWCIATVCISRWILRSDVDTALHVWHLCAFQLWFSRMWQCVVLLVDTNILENVAASISRVEVIRVRMWLGCPDRLQVTWLHRSAGGGRGD
jgi:hypothetical protein